MIVDKEHIDGIEIIPLIDTLRLQKIDDEIYFSKKYSGYISNSRLSLINPDQDNDPQAFFEGLSKHNKYSDALIFGSAVHQLVLQPESFVLVDSVDRPTAKAGFMADELYPLFIANHVVTADEIVAASDKINYYKGKMDADKMEALRIKCENYYTQRIEYEWGSKCADGKVPIYLDPKNRIRLKECVSALERNEAIQKLLHPEGLLSTPISENEQAILLDVEVRVPGYDPFILRIKSKLDNYTIDKETNIVTVNDVKTIGKIVSEFPNNFQKFHYHRELALYSWLLTLIAKKYYGMSDCTVKSNCLVVSTIPNYYTKVYPVSKVEFTRGWEEFKYLLRLVAHYYSKGYRFE